MLDNRPLVLVADRQPEFTRLVALSLGREGFRVEAAHDGVSALDKVSELNPDLLLLGVDLPESSGLELLEELRESHPLPVILVDEQSAAAAVTAGLDHGADDFVAKPFHARELAARVRAVLRRRRRMLGGRRRVGRANVDLDRREVQLDGKPVAIGRVEWLLLEELVTNEGRIMLHEELLTRVWGPEYRDDVPYLRLWIGQLRRRLGIPAWEEGPIRTIQGMGYAFDPDHLIPVMRSRRPRAGRQGASDRAGARQATVAYDTGGR
ncbi:MAG TPA: response regulator transcription factor [Candidatus Limnocylindrales bacterium]|nr:response regulator transcription factor [Candidatus Limnocylindrales bacterium]